MIYATIIITLTRIKPEKQSHANRNGRKGNHKTWFETLNDLVFLCALGAFARKYSCRFENNLLCI
jgi:hypothetical protein